MLVDRAEYLLSMTDIIKVLNDGNIEVKLPEYSKMGSDYSKKETIKYEMTMNRDIKRTKTIIERENLNEEVKTETSIINPDGIEMQRITSTRSNRKVLVYERMRNNPAMVRRTIDGEHEEVFYDNSKSKKLQDITAKKEDRIDKENIEPLTKKQEEEILKNNRNPIYAKGISKLFGIVQTKSSDTGR